MKKKILVILFLTITTLQATTNEYRCQLDFHFNNFIEDIVITINNKKNASVKSLEPYNTAIHKFNYVGVTRKGFDIYQNIDDKEGRISVKNNNVAGNSVGGVEITNCKKIK